QSNLNVDVILDSCERREQEHTQYASGYRQDDGKWQDVALVLRGEKEVHEHEAQDEYQSRLRSCTDFLPRHAGPFVGISPGQIYFSHFANCLDGVAGTVAWFRNPIDGDRVEEVVARHGFRTVYFFQRHD